MSESVKKTYRVKPGMTWGQPPLVEGETVELTEAEAAGFLDLLEPVEGAKTEEAKPAAKPGPSGATGAQQGPKP
jgi:hypothetical protein